jgi:hypothetical protein
MIFKNIFAENRMYNVSQPIFETPLSCKKLHKNRLNTFVIFKKLPKVSHCPIGKNSPNLVNLALRKSFFCEKTEQQAKFSVLSVFFFFVKQHYWLGFVFKPGRPDWANFRLLVWLFNLGKFMKLQK